MDPYLFALPFALCHLLLPFTFRHLSCAICVVPIPPLDLLPATFFVQFSICNLLCMAWFIQYTSSNKLQVIFTIQHSVSKLHIAFVQFSFKKLFHGFNLI